MAVTGTGMFSKPLETLRTLLKGLSAVQEWMGVDGDLDPAASALARIYVNQFDEPDGDSGTPPQIAAAKAARPLIIIGTDQFDSDSNDTSSYWPKTGSNWMEFQEIAQDEDGVETSGNTVTTNDAVFHLMNAVGAIMEAFEAAVEAGGTLDAIGWDLTEQANRVQNEAVPANGIDICGMVVTVRRRDS